MARSVTIDTFPLLQLPNELVQQVITLIHPDDIDAFSICSKATYALAKNVIHRHSELKKVFRYIVLGDDPDPEFHWVYSPVEEFLDPRPLECIAIFFKSREIRYYPKSLCLEPLLYASQPREGDDLDADEASLFDQARMLRTSISDDWRTFVHNCHLILPEEKTEWCGAL